MFTGTDQGDDKVWIEFVKDVDKTGDNQVILFSLIYF